MDAEGLDDKCLKGIRSSFRNLDDRRVFTLPPDFAVEEKSSLTGNGRRKKLLDQASTNGNGKGRMNELQSQMIPRIDDMDRTRKKWMEDTLESLKKQQKQQVVRSAPAAAGVLGNVMRQVQMRIQSPKVGRPV